MVQKLKAAQSNSLLAVILASMIFAGVSGENLLAPVNITLHFDLNSTDTERSPENWIKQTQFEQDNGSSILFRNFTPSLVNSDRMRFPQEFFSTLPNDLVLNRSSAVGASVVVLQPLSLSVLRNSSAASSFPTVPNASVTHNGSTPKSTQQMLFPSSSAENMNRNAIDDDESNEQHNNFAEVRSGNSYTGGARLRSYSAGSPNRGWGSSPSVMFEVPAPPIPPGPPMLYMSPPPIAPMPPSFLMQAPPIPPVMQPPPMMMFIPQPPMVPMMPMPYFGGGLGWGNSYGNSWGK